MRYVHDHMLEMQTRITDAPLSESSEDRSDKDTTENLAQWTDPIWVDHRNT